MLTSRRNLLKVLTAAAAVGTALPKTIANTSGERYLNRRLGLSLRKPYLWHYTALTDFHAAAKQQRLNDTSPEIEAILRNPEAYPFLVVTKFSPDHEDLSPCITVYDEPRIPNIVDAVEGLNEALGYWMNVIPGASAQKEASPISLIGASNAASAKWNFEYTHRAGKTWRVESTTNIVLKGDQMQTFHFMRAEGSEQSVESDLLTCEKSVRYT